MFPSHSIHAGHFDAPDSRPGSGTRLSPIDHKPKFKFSEVGEELAKAHPRPPTEPPESKRGLQVVRTRPLRAGPATSLPPLVRPSGEPPTLAIKTHLLETDSVQHQPEQGHGEGPDSQDKDAESRVWDEEILPLLDQLGSTATVPGRPEASVDLLCDLCDGLHVALARRELLGRRCKRRAQILRTVFRLVDLDSACLDLHIATLCLALCVSGNNLLNICKLIFKISRSETNDSLFQTSPILDAMLRVLSSEDVAWSGEALLYCVGALKFLSGNDALLRLLLANGCVGVAQQLLQKLHPLSESGHALFTTAGHILVQLTATLRNLADLPESRLHFLSHGILSELCIALRHHQEDADVCTNIARIYSKLSSYSECRLALAETHDCYQLFIDLLNKHQKKQDLVVRLLFTLGNLTARSDEARTRLFGCGGCPSVLLRLYRAYQPGEGTPSLGAPSERHDVLVKLVRVLANVCVHPAAGPAMAADALCLQLLMETLERRPTADGELLVNIAATINNLSFYQQDDSAVQHNQLAISQLLLKLMLSSNMEAVLEATRVYGNLTQWKEVRDFVMQNKVYQFVVALLDSQSGEVCFAACGVLTNLSLDPPSRVTLAQEGAVAKLVDCLLDFGPKDWQLAGQVCQTLWNLTEQSGSERGAPLHRQEREALLAALTTYSYEEEALQWTANNDMRDYHKACWEMEFLPVARKLKDRLQPLN
ncbi:Armadillo repeat-containing protein 2 [Merluccius polli]|uniref:Armadillo repeat-containing protein 2 n=1 Tax=Merluccius polli TaxID=89951 RepID=A0AA47MW50_MERPO|nr:Armadillo repeat-containing protein 2 [Merluccius polli]